MINDYLNILMVLLLIRSSFIIFYRIVNKQFKLLQKKNSFLNGYCKTGKSYHSIYQIWGLSALWVIVKYFDYIKGIING